MRLGIRRHVQNLGREIGDRHIERLWRRGRAWATVVDEESEEDRFEVNCSWQLGRGCEGTRAHLNLLSESGDLCVGVGVQRLFDVRIGVKFLTWKQIKGLGLDGIAALCSGYDVFRALVNVDGLSTWCYLAFMTKDDGYGTKRTWSFFPIEVLTGGREFGDCEVLREQRVTLYLGDGPYDVVVRIMRQRRAWKRLPLPDTWHAYSTIDVVEDGMVPGDKSLRGMSCQATTVADAVGQFMASVYKDRGQSFDWDRGRGRGIRHMARAIAEGEG